MSFAAPLGLLALLSLPAIVALHLFRRRLTSRPVAGLFLFAAGDLAASAGRKRTRLLRTPSLWLELAAAFCLSLWLAGISLDAGSGIRHLVVVLDDSASMGARGAQDGSVDRARVAVTQALGELPSSAEATLILTGERPEVVAGPRAPLAVVREALLRWQPVKPLHDPGAALELAVELAGPRDDILFVTDAAGLDVPPRCRSVAVGEPLPNTAIASARRVRGAAGETLLADLVVLAGAPVTTELRVATDTGELARRTVTLVPGRTSHVSIALPGTAEPITVSLSPDALAIDDSVLLLPEPAKVVPVAVLLPESTADLLALDRVLAVLPSVRAVSDPAAAALVLSGSPGRLRPGGVELVVQAGGPAGERDDWVGPFLMDRRHPLLAGVTLDGVVWSAGRGAAPGVALVLAGDQPLLTEEVHDEAVRLTLALDPERSNLPSSPDWPILLANVVERARSLLPGPAAVNVRIGDEILWRSREAEAAASISLVDPEGRAEPARGIGLLSFVARKPGLHRLLSRAGGEVELARFAVAFADVRESDLMRCGAGETAAAPPVTGPGPAAPSGRGRLEGRLLALLLLLLAAADWWVLRARGAP